MRALRLRGFRLEAALTRALAAGVRLRRAKRTARREIAVLTPDPDALRALAEESGIAVRDEGERGLGRWIKKFKRRWTLLPGLILGLWLIAAFSARMWVIRIEAAPQGELDGAARVHIAALLEDMDIVPGSSRPDTRALSSQLAAQCPELSYVSARLTGARLLISAQSAGPQPEIYDLPFCHFIGKPDPRSFRYVLDDLKLEPDQVLLADDAPETIIAYTKIGGKGVLVDENLKPRQNFPAPIIKEITQLTQFTELF